MAVPQNGLIGFFTLDEGEGFNVFDSSGNGKNALLTNDSLWSPLGKSGSCLEWDGGNYAELDEANNLFGLGGKFSVFFAVYRPQGGGSVQMLDLGYRTHGSDSSLNWGTKFIISSNGRPVMRVCAQYDIGFGTEASLGLWGSENLQIIDDEFNFVFFNRAETYAEMFIYNSDGWHSDSINYGTTFTLNWSTRRNLIGAVVQSNFEDDEVNVGKSTPGARADEIGIYNRLTTSDDRDEIVNTYQQFFIDGEINETLAAESWVVNAHNLYSGELSARKVVSSGVFNIAIPGVLSGPTMLTVFPEIGTQWSANSIITQGDNCFPNDPASTPYYFEALSAGTTGPTEPNWPTNPGEQVLDGDVTWQLVERLIQPVTHGPLIPT